MHILKTILTSRVPNALLIAVATSATVVTVAHAQSPGNAPASESKQPAAKSDGGLVRLPEEATIQYLPPTDDKPRPAAGDAAHAVANVPTAGQSAAREQIRLARNQPDVEPIERSIDELGRNIEPGTDDDDESRARRRLTDITATPATQAKLDSLIEDILDPEATLNVVMSRSRLVRLRRPISRVAIADPGIIEFVQFGPRELEIIGIEPGETTLTLWFGEQQEQETIRYLVRVTPDPGDEVQRELEYGELEKRVNELFPNSFIQLIPIADKLLVRGQARDPEEASQIMGIIRGESVNQAGQLIGPQNPYAGGYGGFINQGPAARLYPDASDVTASNIISMLEVPGETQVMLKVRIAELNRSAARGLGMNFTIAKENIFFNSLLGGVGGNLTAIFDGGDITTVINALESNGAVKILAEPNLVTLSGTTANFISGGEFAVPTTVGVGGVGAATTSFRGFGTQLSFTPLVIDKDRIRLNVIPTFSATSAANSVGGIPGLSTRSVQTTVELREGQWLALAGLIQDQQTGANTRVPLLGNIPIIGIAFTSKTITRDETELIVLVSPELVHAMDPEEVPALLPGTEVTEPDDWDFYIRNRFEGPPNCHHRSTVWYTWKHLVKDAKHQSQYQASEAHYISGNHGFTE